MGGPGQQNSQRMRFLLLGTGAIVGLVLAATELAGRAGTQTTELPGDLIARVGGKGITAGRYQAVLQDLESDRRGASEADNRDLALQRLIDEELLVQQGVRMGLVESLPEIRKALATAVIAQTVAEAEAVKPGESDLRELYASDPEFFTRNARYRVAWLVGSTAASSDLRDAHEARKLLLSGSNPDQVAALTGLERFGELPEAFLPLNKLKDYLGPELAEAVSRLSVGTATEPLVADGRVHVVYLTDYQPPTLPAFESARPLVEAEFTRRRGDEALRRQLEELRREHEITIDTGKLAEP